MRGEDTEIGNRRLLGEIREKCLVEASLQVIGSKLYIMAYFCLWLANGEEVGGEALVVDGQ